MSDPKFFIESDRLYLSYLFPENDAHCDFLVDLYNTPEFIASIGGERTSVTTRENARAQLSGRFRNEHARNGYGTYLISLKPESTEHDQASPANSTPVGTVSLSKRTFSPTHLPAKPFRPRPFEADAEGEVRNSAW